jgi:molybdate transport system substrate-binding protein
MFRCAGRRLLRGAACLLAALAASVASPAAARAADPPVVAAASDLQFALEEIALAFTAATGERVRLVFGSSGNFARQIRQGAPFEIFFSADERYVEDLARDGHARDAGVLYGIGRLALIAPRGGALAPDATLADLRRALRDGRLRKFAIANPEHAPYGRRAEEALRHAGLWDEIRPRLVLGENVSQAAQFALSGSAQGGIVAYSLVLSPRVGDRAVHALLPADWHSPLRQRAVLLAGASPAAERFFAHVQAPAARAVLRRYGFALPGSAG